MFRCDQDGKLCYDGYYAFNLRNMTDEHESIYKVFSSDPHLKIISSKRWSLFVADLVSTSSHHKNVKPTMKKQDATQRTGLSTWVTGQQETEPLWNTVTSSDHLSTMEHRLGYQQTNKNVDLKGR